MFKSHIESLKFSECVYDLIANNNYTIRSAAKELGVSKSSLHNFIHNEFKESFPVSYAEITKVLDIHYKYKYINGGQATRLKYEKLKEIKEKELKAVFNN